MFYRDFMDYHQDRFNDYSLMVYKKDKLVALFPANVNGDQVFSHQGLTFGGVLLPFNIDSKAVFDILDAISHFLHKEGKKSLEIKSIPEIYFQQASNEINYYALNHHAAIKASHMVLAIDYSKPLSIHKTKLKNFRNNSYDFVIEESQSLDGFWKDILVPRLRDRHQSDPVHSLEEITLLKSKFPNQIKQFNISLDGEILAGITIFENEHVVKSQYGATSAKGEKTRALDYLFLHLIYKYQSLGKRFFSMGTVTDSSEFGYSPGMLKNKEELGCSMSIQNVFRLKLS